MRGIFGSKRNASSTYGQVIARSKKVLENVLKEKDEQQMKYVLSVAGLKAKGKDLSIVELKKFFHNTMMKGEVTLKKMQSVNFYLNSLMPEEAKKFIENLKNSKRRNTSEIETLQ